MVIGDHDGVVTCFGMKKGEAVVSIAFGEKVSPKTNAELTEYS